MIPTIKNLWMVLLVCIVLSDCKDKGIDPENYNGDYPYYKDGGNKIRTYQPKFKNIYWTGPMNGMCQLSFNEHEWNHWPYITSNSIRYPNNSTFDISFFALTDIDCIKESINFKVAAKPGLYKFGKNIEYGKPNPAFSTEDCDAGKDRIEVNQEADNWVNITWYDSLSRPNETEGSFDLTFKIVRKNLSYSIVYPNTIRMRGSFKQKIQVP
jgi:hypothetical protein